MARPAVLHMRDTARARRAWLRSSFLASARELRAAGHGFAAAHLERRAAAMMPRFRVPSASDVFEDADAACDDGDTVVDLRIAAGADDADYETIVVDYEPTRVGREP